MPEVVHLRARTLPVPARGRRRAAAGPRLALLPGHDIAMFRAALAVVAIAVADDAYVHPEPGVVPGDHIVSGLVPLGVLVTLAATAPRLPVLLRGWLAIFTGALAITAGVTDGIRHIAVDRLSGDDVTAVLRGLAGGLGVLVCAILIVLPAGIAVIATHKARSPLTAMSLGRAAESVRLTTSDGLKLRAWYVPSRNGAAVIAFPGRSQPAPHARMLIRHGYGVLLLDRRGEGESEGDYNAFGWAGETDLRAAIAFLQRRPDVDPGRIGGLGLSVGGELLLQTAAHTRALRAVVSEGAGQRSLAEHLDNPQVGTVQRWFTGMLAQTAAVAVLSNSTPPDGLADLMPRIAPRRVLLIEALHGNPDEVLNEVYARAAGDSGRLWKVAQGGHTGALAAVPGAYEQRVIDFFDRALLAR
jgi:uncharacterized protein